MYRNRGERLVQLATLANMQVEKYECDVNDDDANEDENYSPSNDGSLSTSSEESIYNEEAMRELDVPNISLEEKMAAFANSDASGQKYYSVIGEKRNNSTRESVYESRFLIENKYKKTFCKFCEYQIVSKHFVQHLENKHGREKEVIQLNELPKNSKDADVVQRRKNLITILRNDRNLESALRGQIIPKRLPKGHTEVTVTGEHSLTSQNIEDVTRTIEEDVRKKRAAVYESGFLIEKKYKKTVCPFCEDLIINKHFARHLENKHKTMPEVIQLSKFEKKDPKRKNMLTLIRNSGNLDNALRGEIIPKRLKRGETVTDKTHIICPSCKSFYKKEYLFRHRKKCFANPDAGKENGRHTIINSFIYAACQKRYGKYINSMMLKGTVLNTMRGDEMSEIILQDILILSWGDDLLKKTPPNRSVYHISAKMRRCARFLASMREISPRYSNMLSCLQPDAFDDVIEATKIMSGYDPETRTFSAGSTALQFGAYLKQITDLTVKIVLRKRIELPVDDLENRLLQLKRFKKLIESQWTTELGSLAMKHLNKRAALKPALLPLTEDVMKVTKYVNECMETAYNALRTKRNQKSYSTLVECVLVSSILHNRKRVGDIMYLEIDAYEQQRKHVLPTAGRNEFLDSLTEGEKILVNSYVKINAIGKGSRTVPVLIPQTKLKFFDLIFKIRHEETSWWPEKNVYFFTFPKSTKWIDGTSSIRKYAVKCGAKQPQLLTCVRLRKHVARVTQLLSLRDNEIEQLAKFMGHSRMTHEQYYKLPEDVFQTAKVSKILQIMEQGNAAQYKNKNLDQIDINVEEEVVDDEDIDDPQPIEQNEADEPVEPNLIEENNEEDKRDTTELAEDGDIEAKSDGGLGESSTSTRRKSRARNDGNHQLNERTAPPQKKRRTSSNMTKGTRQKWSPTKKALVLKHFRGHISRKQFPKKCDIDSFINRNSQFQLEDLKRIRTLVVNSYNK